MVLPVRAFHDTGFGVREPLSGCGVVLVRFAAVEARLPACLTYLFKRNVFRERHPAPPELGVRLVPCDTVAGHCLLPAVPAQALRWTARGRQQTRHGLYAAFCDMPPPPPGLDAAGGVGCDGGIMMLQILKLLFDRLWAALACPGGVHYVSGAQSLPPPLTPEEEKQLLARMMAGDAAARDELITHNLRLVVYLAKSTRTAACRRRT